MFLSLCLLALACLAIGEDLPVCIIGAGIAGIKAGSDLERAQIPYLIVEGSARIGGRVYPVPFDDGFLQTGAAYINSDDNPIFEIALARGLIADFNATCEGDHEVVEEVNGDEGEVVDVEDTYAGLPIYTETGVIEGQDLLEFENFTGSFLGAESCVCESFYSNNGESTDENMTVNVGEILAEFEKERQGEALGVVFQKELQTFLSESNRSSRRSAFDALARMYITNQEISWAADMNKFALANYGSYDAGSENGTEFEFAMNKFGYKTILDVIAANIPKTKIRFNSTVSKIDYSSGSAVKLTTSTGPIDCRSVIVTCSLGYLKKHSASLFNPPLPQKKNAAINALGFGVSEQVYLVYDKPWLEETQFYTMGPLTSVIFGRGLSFDTVSWSEKVVEFWFSGPAVAAIEVMSDEQLMGEITTHLKSTLKNMTVPSPQRVVRHKWLSDPLILGYGSYLTPASVALGDAPKMLADPIMGGNGRPLVQFAGEATHSTSYQTTIGAFLSGQREAARLTEK